MATVVIWNRTLVRAMTVKLSFETERPKFWWVTLIFKAPTAS